MGKRTWHRALDSHGVDYVTSDGIHIIKRGERSGWEAYFGGIGLVETATLGELKRLVERFGTDPLAYHRHFQKGTADG